MTTAHGKISAILIVRNEERNLEYCLQSIRWCDEIVVVDMESDDGTIGVARKYTDKIFSHKKVEAFDIARKLALEKASGEWVVSIDADEMIKKDLSDTIIDLAKKNAADVFYFPRKNYIMGQWIQHTGWWPDYQLRFFRHDSVWFNETLHGFVVPRNNARVQYLEPRELNAFSHFNFKDSFQLMEKINNYTSIEASLLRKHGNGSLKWYKMLFNSVSEMCKRYVVYKGFKDGYHGFCLSVMMGFYKFLMSVKLWELSIN